MLYLKISVRYLKISGLKIAVHSLKIARLKIIARVCVYVRMWVRGCVGAYVGALPILLTLANSTGCDQSRSTSEHRNTSDQSDHQRTRTQYEKEN